MSMIPGGGRRMKVQGHLWLYREIKESLCYRRPCLNKTKPATKFRKIETKMFPKSKIKKTNTIPAKWTNTKGRNWGSRWHRSVLERWDVKEISVISSQLLAAISQTYSSPQRERLSVKKKTRKRPNVDGKKEGRQGDRLANIYWALL